MILAFVDSCEIAASKGTRDACLIPTNPQWTRGRDWRVNASVN